MKVKKWVALFLSGLFINLFLWNSFATSLLEKTETRHIVLRHSLEGILSLHLEKIVKKFNATSPKMTIILEFGGNYTESFDKTFQEKKKSKRPHLLLVSEYNTKTMFDRKRDYKPIDEIIHVDKINFVPVIRAFYSFEQEKNKPRLMSLPFACSTGVVYYNATAFKEAGIHPPKGAVTWDNIEEMAAKLHKIGYWPFTVAWSPAYIIEHFATVNHIPFADPFNGFGEGTPTLKIDQKPFIHQMKRVVKWHQDKFYFHAKTNQQAEANFIEGKVAILMQGANRESSLQDLLKKSTKPFEIGVMEYPYESSLTDNPNALAIGGTSLWVLEGHEGEKEGVALFLNYLAQPEVQAEWHQMTGYLPVTTDAYEMTLKQNFYETHPVYLTACQQVIERKLKFPNAIRLPHYAIIRNRITQGIDEMLAGADVEKTLQTIVMEANKLMSK